MQCCWPLQVALYYTTTSLVELMDVLVSFYFLSTFVSTFIFRLLCRDCLVDVAVYIIISNYILYIEIVFIGHQINISGGLYDQHIYIYVI